MKDCIPKPELGYVECIETREDGSTATTQIPFAANDDGPSSAQKLANFSKATINHVRTGRKKATDDQVDERFNICSQCPSCMYRYTQTLPTLINTGEVVSIDIGKCNHMSCGCLIAPASYKHSTNMLNWPNKLRWADQACPAGHWGAIDADAV